VIAMKTLMIAILFVVACGKDNPADEIDAGSGSDFDAEPIDAGGPIDADCVTDPVTSAQLMNACTTAQRIEKHPVLPLRLPDGGLPPLP